MTHLIAFSTRRFLGAVAFGLIALSAVPAGAAAATSPITFGVSLRTAGDCIAVITSASNPTQVTLKDSAGNTKAQGTVPADGVFFCLDNSTWVDSGDKLKANDGTFSRTFTVPQLSIEVDRVNNLYHGFGPAGRTIKVEYPEAIFGDVGKSQGVRVASDGTWSLDPGRDLLWRMDGSVSWKSPNGDRVAAYGQAPFIAVTIGKAAFSGAAASPFASFEASIQNSRTGSADVDARLSGDFAGTFRSNSGRAVKVAAGDHFSAPGLASDADWTVPAVQATGNADTNKVKGSCQNLGNLSGVITVDIYRAGTWRGGALLTNVDDGQFTVDLDGREDPFFTPVNLKSGDTILIGCMLATGDWVSQSFTTP